MENNIHNDFFISIIKNRENAIDFLSGVLPDKILKEIDFNYLDFDDTAYIQNRFKDLFSDIVIKTKINNKNTDIFILIEHKSTAPDDKALFLQTLNYIYSMLELDFNNKKDFRIIIPLVFYHGERKWKIPRYFLDLYDVNDDIKQFLLNFSYLLPEICNKFVARRSKSCAGKELRQSETRSIITLCENRTTEQLLPSTRDTSRSRTLLQISGII